LKTITITQDDSGQLMVDVDQDGQPVGEPYSCESPDECLEYVGEQLAGQEPAEDMLEPAEPAADDYEKTWNEEAAKRPSMM
jgi:hypothetical protein